MTRPRFSLRGLIVLTVVVAAFCWYRDLPRQKANRFAVLLEAGEYKAASQLIVGHEGFSAQKILPLPSRRPDWEVAWLEQTPKEWLHGRYRMSVHGEVDGYRYQFAAASYASGIWVNATWEVTAVGKH